MSLFERLNNKRYDLQEAIDDKGNITPEPGDIAKEKSILRNIKKKQVRLDKNQKKIINTNTKAGDKLLQDINKRKSADLTRADAINRSMDSYDDGDLGNPNQSKSSTATKTKTVKQSEVSKQAKDFTKKINKQNKNLSKFVNPEVRPSGEVKPKTTKPKTTIANYPKTRPELIAKRKEYGIDRKGNISDAGVKRYAQKTKQLSSGSNLPVTPTQKELEIAKKRAVGGTPIKNKDGKVIGTTTGKYGGKLSRKRPSNAPSLAQIKAKIDAKNPTYKSPISGGELPLKNTRSPVDTFLNKIKKASKQDPEGLKKAVNKFPDFPEPKKLPKKVLVKTPKSLAFPQGFKPVDTKTKEGEKIARRVTKKFVTDKELLTGEKPKDFKPPVNNKSKNVFSRIKGFAKKFHQKMVQDAGFRRTSGSGKYVRDTFGIPAKDINKTRHIFKNTIRGNTFRLLNKALPGHYKTLAAAGLIAYGLSNRGKKKDEGKGNNVAIPKNPYAGKKFKNVTGTLKLGDGNKK